MNNQNGYLLAQIAHKVFNTQIVEMVLTQLSMARGLKMWGRQAELAIDAEMKQLQWHNTVKLVGWQDLSISQEDLELHLFFFLKQKSTGKVKACHVAGGSKQRDFISKEDTSSLSAVTKSIILTSIVDVNKSRKDILVNISNMCIQTRVDDHQKDCVAIQVQGFMSYSNK